MKRIKYIATTGFPGFPDETTSDIRKMHDFPPSAGSRFSHLLNSLSTIREMESSGACYPDENFNPPDVAADGTSRIHIETQNEYRYMSLIMELATITAPEDGFLWTHAHRTYLRSREIDSEYYSASTIAIPTEENPIFTWDDNWHPADIHSEHRSLWAEGEAIATLSEIFDEQVSQWKQFQLQDPHTLLSLKPTPGRPRWGRDLQSVQLDHDFSNLPAWIRSAQRGNSLRYRRFRQNLRRYMPNVGRFRFPEPGRIAWTHSSAPQGMAPEPSGPQLAALCVCAAATVAETEDASLLTIDGLGSADSPEIQSVISLLRDISEVRQVFLGRTSNRKKARSTHTKGDQPCRNSFRTSILLQVGSALNRSGAPSIISRRTSASH